MSTDGVVVVNQIVGGDRPIDNSIVPNTSDVSGQAFRQRVEAYSTHVGRVVHLASAPLPDSGAFTDQDQYSIPEGVSRISYVVTYTRGADGGRARLRPRWGNGTEEASDVVARSELFPAGDIGAQQLYIHELSCPIPQSASPIVFVVSMRVPAGIVSCRLLAAEVGDTGNPGTCQITIGGGS